MLELIIILGGMVIAGYQARQEHKTQSPAPATPNKEMLPADMSSAVAGQAAQVSSQDYLKQYEQDTDHYLAATGIAGGLSLLAIGFPPLGIVALSLLTYLAIPMYKSAYVSIFIDKEARSSTVDAITWAACLVTGLYVLGSLAYLVYFFGVRQSVKTEQSTRNKLASAIPAPPSKVWVMCGESEVEVPFESLQVGDVLVLQAGESIPIDGRIMRGMAAVDQSALTGEAHPVEKAQGDPVFAATLVISGKIFVEVRQTGAATQAANIQRVLDHTVDFTSTVQTQATQFADSLAAPTLIAGGVTALAMGPASGSAMVGANQSDINRLTAPLGMLNYLEISLDRGVLIKDGRCLEQLRTVDTVVFDKTGTLTLDQPQVEAIHAFGACSADTLLRFAAAAERKHSHPIAKAIKAYAGERMIDVPAIDDARYELGMGIRVELEHQVIHVGSARFMQLSGNVFSQPARHEELQAHAAQRGSSLVYVAVDGIVMGALELHSSIRPEAQSVIRQLRARGLEVVIISGDHEAPTRNLANRLDVERYHAGVLPTGKARILEELRRQGRSVCFVGDGVNDAVALKTANVSISLHGAADIALDTAGVVLLDGTLGQLCPLFELSDELQSTKRQDYIATTVPGIAGAAGVLLLGFGLPATLMLYVVGLGAAIGVAEWPKLSRRLGAK